MNPRIPRRDFLRTAGSAALAGAGLPRTEDTSAGRTPTASAPTPRLFAGCCAYSFRKYLASGRMTMEDFILKGVELGLHGVDITGYWLKSAEPPYLVGLRHLAFKNGMPFSGAACGVSMVQAEKSERDAALEEIKKWVDTTETLGASHLRIFAGKLPESVTTQQGIEWAVEVMKPACDYASRKGVTLGVETHEGITQRADATLEIMRRVDSPYAGVNLDITNFLADSDEDQYQQIEACVPFASHTHIRDRFGNSQHPVDLDRVWRLFVKGGYKGYMSAEYEGEEDPMTAAPRLIERIKTLCRKYSSA